MERSQYRTKGYQHPSNDKRTAKSGRFDDQRPYQRATENRYHTQRTSLQVRARSSSKT